jgi:hypothetical protein
MFLAVRLASGEEIFGTVHNDREKDIITISEPMQLVTETTPDGLMLTYFEQLAQYAWRRELEIDRRHVVWTCPVSDVVYTYYRAAMEFAKLSSKYDKGMAKAAEILTERLEEKAEEAAAEAELAEEDKGTPPPVPVEPEVTGDAVQLSEVKKDQEATKEFKEKITLSSLAKQSERLH